MIQKESKTDWEEMYKVFNMGHRMELYLPKEYASEIIAISERFGVEAKVIGRVESADKAQVTIDGEKGKYIYH
jgi:phosphoribosylformylglycinamidine cyclo-ligase